MNANLKRLPPASPYALTAEDRALLTARDDFIDVPSRGPALTTVVQPTGKDLDPASPKYVEGARPGDIAMRFSDGESIAASSINFIPVALITRFNVFEPSQGGEQGAFREPPLDKRPPDATWHRDANGRRQCLLPDGAVVKEQKMLVAIEETTKRSIVIEAHSTALAAMNAMLDRATGCRVAYTLPNGAIDRLRGMFLTKWSMSTEEQRKGSYRWFGPSFELLGKLGEMGGPTIEEVLRARRARETFINEGVVSDDTVAPTPALEAPREQIERPASREEGPQQSEAPPPGEYDGPDVFDGVDFS
jgi:hypothetical protein